MVGEGIEKKQNDFAAEVAAMTKTRGVSVAGDAQGEPNPPAQPAYQRILLKLSGEALMGDDSFGINRETVDRIVGEVKEVSDLGVQVGVVIGGGNIFRGVSPGRGGHGPRHRRLHGHARHRDQRARPRRTR